MIIVFKPNAPEEAKLRVRVQLENQGFIIHESKGANITLFGIVGDTSNFDATPFMEDEAVEQVVEITKRGRSTKWEQLKFAIIGMGLIGGSYAKALRNLGVKNIIAVEIDKEVCLQVQRLGLANLVLTEPNEALREADVIICAVYPESIVEFLRNNVQYFKEDVLITDVSGIKGTLTRDAHAELKVGMEFISGHPMAGRQGSGLGMSEAEIFRDANYIIVPEKYNREDTIQWLEKFAMALGCRNTVRVTPEEHDRIIAYTSNLTHVTAVALMNSISYNDKTKFFVAGSFKDGSRVADINPELWCSLFLANKEKVVDEIDKYIEQLDLWRKALRAGDGEQMKDMMRVAAARRKELY